ncbi:Brp/Blh family beta-carotene 15,15'-dioxygenase [Modestobacter sp. VKM Ac-2979]|uniref:Brp/Blh family beta-carotene 15,15'-dioxygenase n=1 Tax=unclassified Modestobacter TaxID=2643866 RepID=UPI0022ABB38C|nr:MULTISPECIES: Brp/Blh family beta-carotene 15,15'-dioxygenase [unclassified Modestobacter]MCZ2811704.1 Brp/Blh family beta-carotene 15,15'-dioxygenase [Modestobacter sp. VKM Ac-2979]MCZ2843427.1 Brp/Blh family beta-carotene 15,15'-dioxygenase [Modestobacter sp. VKM Ac-2980]
MTARAPLRVTALTTRLSVGVVGAVVGAAVLLPDRLSAWGLGVLAVGVLVGLPHGAVDHLVPDWVAGRPGRMLRPGVLVGYAVTALVALGALLVAPVVSLLLLFVVSAVHFGMGEVAFDAERSGTPWRPALRDVAPVVGLGGVPVAVPLARWPEEADRVLATLSPELPGLLTPGVRQAALAVVGVALLGTVLGALARGRPGWAAEAGLLAALFTLAPPAAAFGAYFGGWHAVRHIGRLLVLDPRNGEDLAAGRLGAPLLRYATAAAVPTGVALAGIALLVLSAQRPDWTAGALAVLLCLTVPHMAVVALLDRRTAAGLRHQPERVAPSAG